MKLAYITTHFPFGHDETFFQPEVRSLAQRVERLYVLPARPRGPVSAFGDLGSTDVYLPAYRPSTFVRAAREFARAPLAALSALGAVLRPRYRLAAKLKNVSLFPKALATTAALRELEVDHIHAQWLTTSASVAFIAARLLRVPWSCTAHQHDIFFDNLIPEKVADAAFLRVISRRNARHLIELAGESASRRTHVVHVGVDIPATFVQRAPAGDIRIICAARLEPSKGHRHLVDALKILADRGVSFTCDLAGRGVLHEPIEAQITQLGLTDRVRLVGPVHHDELTRRMREGEYDISVLASTEEPGVHEGIPVALMESMAAGIACVATTTGSNDELIDERCGILVPQRDPQALADALTALARDAERRSRLGLAGRERTLREFETNATVEQLLALVRASS